MGKILVTGASGIVGVRIVSGLLDKGYEVIGTDYKPQTYNQNKNGYDFVALSPVEKEKFSKLFEENVIDCVVHAACTADNDFIGDEKALTIDEKSLEESRVWDSFLYKMANLVQVRQFILISTTQIYQLPETREPVREDDDVKPLTNYAKLKFAAENAMALEFKKTRSTAVCAARCTPFYSKNFPDNLRAKIIDPKDGTAFMYRTGEYGYHFCNIYNLVDFVISYIRNTEKLKEEERIQHTGYYNVGDKELISANEIVTFLREYHSIGTILQKKENEFKKTLGKKLFGSSKLKGDALSNYRYLDEETILGNHRFEINKAARICPFRWKLDNVK